MSRAQVKTWGRKISYQTLTHPRLKLFRDNLTNFPLGSSSSNPLRFCDIFFRYWNIAIFSIFCFVNSVSLFYKQTLPIFYSAQLRPPWTQNRWNFFDIFYCSRNINNSIFESFNSAPYSVFKNVDLKKVFCTHKVFLTFNFGDMKKCH